MSSASIVPTQQQLQPVNDLTRASPVPGNLDYTTYSQYLRAIYHVKPTGGTLNPDLAAHNTHLQHRLGDRTDTKTDFRADQVLWSPEDLPDLIYEFEQPGYWLAKHNLKEPPVKTYPIYGNYLRDIPILPDHISNNLEGWRLEAWMRFDARVGLDDILLRIHPIHRPKNKSLIQMRTSRFREQCNVLGWTTPGASYASRKMIIQNQMLAKGISLMLNTTRGLSWGLVNPASGPNSTRIPAPQTLLNSNTVESVTANLLQPLPVTLPATTQLLSNNPQLLFNAANPGPVVVPSTPQKRNRADSQQTIKTEESEAEDNEFNEEDKESIQDAGSLYQSPPRTRCPEEVRAATPTPPSRHGHSVVVVYQGEPLVLKTRMERVAEQEEMEELLAQWHPSGTEGRRRQLAYILDEDRLAGGFVDNRGYWPPVGHQGCLEEDIIYGVKK